MGPFIIAATGTGCLATVLHFGMFVCLSSLTLSIPVTFNQILYLLAILDERGMFCPTSEKLFPAMFSALRTEKELGTGIAGTSRECLTVMLVSAVALLGAGCSSAMQASAVGVSGLSKQFSLLAWQLEEPKSLFVGDDGHRGAVPFIFGGVPAKN